jgi:hypothetical protein
MAVQKTMLDVQSNADVASTYFRGLMPHGKSG